MEKIVLREDLEVKDLVLSKDNTTGKKTFSGILKKGTILKKDGGLIGINEYGQTSSYGWWVMEKDGLDLWERARELLSTVKPTHIYNSILFSKQDDDKLYFHQYRHDAYETENTFEIPELRDIFSLAGIPTFLILGKMDIGGEPFGRIQAYYGFIARFSRIFTTEPLNKDQFIKLKELLHSILMLHRKEIQKLIEKTSTADMDILFENPTWADGGEKKAGVAI